VPATPPIALLLACALPLLAAPSLVNPGFEGGLAGWTTSGVRLETAEAHQGSRSLDLQDGWIEQTITGLSPGETHLLGLAYRDSTPEGWILSHARIRIDGQPIAELHNGQENEFLACNSFEFTPTDTSATLRVETIPDGLGRSDDDGFLLDSFAVSVGSPATPPATPWSALTPIADSRGGRRLVNGSFEDPVAAAAADPCNSGPDGNPHLTGTSLPSWLVARENVDVIQWAGSVPDGTHVLDLGGHGPGHILQTITGLDPGKTYTFSLLHARHLYWEDNDMTADLLANGRHIAELRRTSSQTWDDGYELIAFPLLADATGTLTLELRSTIDYRGGGIVIDDLRLAAGGDRFLAWSLDRGVVADPDANDDRDRFDRGLEFLLRLEPGRRDFGDFLEPGPPARLRLPLSGEALAHGFTLDLMTSRDLDDWRPASDPDSGLTLDSDDASPGTDGERLYLIDPSEPTLFWQLKRNTPPPP